MSTETTAVNSPLQEDDNAAWVKIPTQMSATALHAFCEDIERLMRINPMLEYSGWEQLDGQRYHMVANNLSNQQQLDVMMSVSVSDNGLRIEYESGVKKETRFEISESEQGSDLLITEEYHAIDEADTEQLEQVDKSLTIWAKDLQFYLHRWHRWAWCRPWRWYMQRVWQPMKPSSRRICYMLLWISAAEIVAFLMIFAIFMLEIDRYFNL